jgi:hypothetical protein
VRTSKAESASPKLRQETGLGDRRRRRLPPAPKLLEETTRLLRSTGPGETPPQEADDEGRRGGEGLGEPGGDLQDLGGRESAFRDQAIEGLPLDEPHRQKVDAVHLLDGVDGDDPGVVEGGERLDLTPETIDSLRACGHRGGQDLESHLAPEPRVGGAVHLAHPAGPDRGGDAVVGEGLAGQGCHSR